MKNLTKKIWTSSLILILILSQVGCKINDNNLTEDYSGQPVAKEEFLLDTICTITLYSTDDTTIIDDAFQEIKRLENLISNTITTSDISKINAAKGQPVEVSPEVLELLQKSIEYGDATNGILDITCGVMTDAWHFSSNEDHIIPDAKLLEEAAKHVNYKNIVIEGNKVSLKDQEAKLDLGAMGKGFIADKISDYLKAKGVTGAIINLGGNVLTVGEKPSGEPWYVGIRKPFEGFDDSLGTVEVGERSIGTSGIYERGFEKDGTYYHHILDVKTGWPKQNDILSVTIISPKSVDGEGLSTSCFIMPMDEALAWIETIPSTEAIFITKDYKVHTTSGIGTTTPFVPKGE